MISLHQVSKYFGCRQAVDALSFEVAPGTVYGLLGHNGAGKSTTIGMLLGHLSIDEGEITIHGISVEENRPAAIRRIGALFEAPAFYGYLSGRHNLEAFMAYSGSLDHTAINRVAELVGLDRRIDDRVRTYSHGMRTRLALAQALLPSPEILILDEPTDGLDPEGIHEMRKLIQQLNREMHLTILLSSHLLSEVEQICHRIGIIRQGNLLFDGDWKKAVQQASRFQVAVDNPEGALKHCAHCDWIGSCRMAVATAGESPSLEVELMPDIPSSQLTAFLVSQKFQVYTIAPMTCSLEAFYLQTLSKAKLEAGAPTS